MFCSNFQAVVAAKPEVAAPVHEDWIEPVEPVASWADDAAPAAAAAGAAAPAFGAAPAQEDWAAQVSLFHVMFTLYNFFPEALEIDHQP